ncbi:hypothetical protein MKEN_00318500 [Mycena kentingensis (nom. inval.)]|nr:hypothetical protein MKEN_00318500 [Mycena kentingensis (nom. inval.)]
MPSLRSFTLFAALAGLRLASAHVAFFHPSMYGFNVTDQTFPYDNRPVSPLINGTFSEWWFHGHLDFPPNPDDIFELPAGRPATTQLACHKAATSFFASSESGDIRIPSEPNAVCPNSPTTAYHTNGLDDLTGCALAIAYKSDARDVQPEDFTVFSVNQTSCPEGGCTCAFFWIHAPDSGGEQNYMNGFKCNVTQATSTVPLAAAKVPRRCGADTARSKYHSAPGNCTYGAKQPFYWFQAERNNMFEDTYAPPIYTDLYAFTDGAQDDIFEDSYVFLPDPSPTAPLPILNTTIDHEQLPLVGATSVIARRSRRTVGSRRKHLARRHWMSRHSF